MLAALAIRHLAYLKAEQWMMMRAFAAIGWWVIRRKQLGVGASDSMDDAAGAGLGAKSGSSAARAREAAAAEEARGRPRHPGDEDGTPRAHPRQS